MALEKNYEMYALEKNHEGKMVRREKIMNTKITEQQAKYWNDRKEDYKRELVLAEDVEEEKTQGKKSPSQMNKAELEEYCVENGIEGVDFSKTKQEIIAAIKAV